MARCSGRTPSSAERASALALTPISAVRPPGRTTLAVFAFKAATPTLRKFMPGEPMKAATNLFAGAL